jgi:hypothetical protein
VENRYIFSKSIARSSKDIRSWVLDNNGYDINSSGSFKVKSKIIDRIIKDENGENISIKEKLVCYWSK